MSSWKLKVERDKKDKVAIFLCVPSLRRFNYYSFSLARTTREEAGLPYTPGLVIKRYANDCEYENRSLRHIYFVS